MVNGESVTDIVAYTPSYMDAAIADAAAKATKLAAVVEDRKLYTLIERKDRKTGKIVATKFLHVEAWQLIGWAYGLTVKVVEAAPVYRPTDGAPKLMGVRARAEVVNREGVVVGGAVSFCDLSEPGRDNEKTTLADLSGMASTRATSRALRGCLGWVVGLAGYGDGEEVRLLEDG